MTCQVPSSPADVTRVLRTIRWAEWRNRNRSTGSAGCVPTALPGAALTILAMAQAVCPRSPESVRQESPLKGAQHALGRDATRETYGTLGSCHISAVTSVINTWRRAPKSLGLWKIVSQQNWRNVHTPPQACMKSKMSEIQDCKLVLGELLGGG